MKKRNYGKLLHYDAITILAILFVSIILEIFIFETTSNYDYLILVILYIIVASYNKSAKKKSLGIIMIIASILIIVESVIGFSSLFNLIFTLLGCFSIWHSICYLKNLR